MFELTIQNLKKYLDGHLILKSVSLEVYAGEKVGIVGENGGGKSTLLKVIAGIEPMNYWPGYPQTTSPGYDEGLINLPRQATCAYLQQIPDYPPGVTVMDVLNKAFEEVRSMEEEMRHLEEAMKQLQGEELEKALQRYSRLMELYEMKGGYNTGEKLGRVITGLHFDEDFLKRDFSLLSGGEKTTAVLGKLLIDQPDILLLDEPTNHLDLDAIQWLEEYLKTYRGMVIVISHDRYFLDHVVTKIVEIEDRRSVTYKGNYSSYAEQKEENLRVQYEQYCNQQKEIKAMENQVKELRDWAMRSDNNKFFQRAASIQNKLDRMERIPKPTLKRRIMNFDVKEADRSGKETVKVENLAKSFGEKEIFREAELMVRFGERVAMIGPNGSGKTTLIRMLLGEESPDQGVAKLGAGVSAAYLPQRIVFDREELTALDFFREDLMIAEGKAREHLSKFKFYGNSVFTKLKHLSGGEKIRLKLARLFYEDINLIILDEPTNHLDIPSIEKFEEILEEFQGTVFFISHDRYFINRIAERVIAIEDHRFKSYPGNYTDYKSELEKRKIAADEETMAMAENEAAAKGAKGNWFPGNQGEKTEKSRPLSPERRFKMAEAKMSKLEAGIKSLEQELRQIEEAMEETGSDYEELGRLYERKEELEQSLEQAMEEWTELETEMQMQLEMER